MILGIYGSGGTGREVYDMAVRRNAVSALWNEIVFIDDFRGEGLWYGTRSLRFETLQQENTPFQCIVAIGEPMDREMMYNKLMAAGISLATLVDPTALISPTAKIGAGTILCEFSTIRADVQIGCNCLIQPYCCIGHNIHVGDHSIISAFSAPGGWSAYGKRVFVGMHASIRDKITIGDDVIIGMGAAVFQDVPAGATVVGNPARITRGNAGHNVFR